MEYCTGSLREFWETDAFRNLQPTEQIVTGWDVVAQIGAGLKSCQSLNPVVIHRDIKPDNGAIP
jgi:serine/threonine protein kinase